MIKDQVWSNDNCSIFNFIYFLTNILVTRRNIFKIFLWNSIAEEYQTRKRQDTNPTYKDVITEYTDNFSHSKWVPIDEDVNFYLYFK